MIIDGEWSYNDLDDNGNHSWVAHLPSIGIVMVADESGYLVHSVAFGVDLERKDTAHDDQGVMNRLKAEAALTRYIKQGLQLLKDK